MQVPAEAVFTQQQQQQKRESSVSTKDSEDNIFASASVTWIAKEGMDASSLTVFGNRSIIGVTTPMTPTISFRTNTLSELFIDMTVVYLERQEVLPFSRSQAIPREFLPPPFNTTIAFQNPLFPNAVISLNTLLMHTSSFTEAGFTAGAAQTPGPVMSLTSFVESTLANSGTSGLWGTAQPGLASSYQYSRLNTALVTYILEKVILKLEGVETSLATFVQNTFITPMGLRGTFLVDTTGTAPAPNYPPNSVSLLTANTVQDVTSDGKGIPSSVIIHAAYASDYMYYTTVLDLVKLAGEVFLGGQFASLGPMLKNDTISLVSSSSSSTGNSNSNLPGVISRSVGVYGFDPKQLCQITSLGGICQFESDIDLYGWIVGGEYNQVALLCTAEKCAAAEVSFPSSTVTSYSRLVELALSSLVEVKENPKLEGGELYPLYVFIGVLSTIIVVVVVSYIADYVIRPAPAAAPLPVNKVALPTNTAAAGGAATTTMDTVEMNNINNNNNMQGVSSPVRRLDMYD
ncbi:uncharacterized protein TM35_000321280 [Trypanosoma theileri]|uniref:Beta-lactamase-related domain-containing protein n=1 Tax=Trypanosoma theileri TaxID=67003 RepID=A0A1X0NMU7_9TRYP|nr:uncharacterized protein TM35_000321280 [Trypanosoma theileri]ORC85813.1 hypothetical protein TM35_000321280 [Trypanosoma theileri]